MGKSSRTGLQFLVGRIPRLLSKSTYINVVSKWADKWQLKLSYNECHHLRVSLRVIRLLIIYWIMFLCHCTDFDVRVNSVLSFSEHTNDVVAKAKQYDVDWWINKKINIRRASEFVPKRSTVYLSSQNDGVSGCQRSRTCVQRCSYAWPQVNSRHSTLIIIFFPESVRSAEASLHVPESTDKYCLHCTGRQNSWRLAILHPVFLFPQFLWFFDLWLTTDTIVCC